MTMSTACGARFWPHKHTQADSLPLAPATMNSTVPSVDGFWSKGSHGSRSVAHISRNRPLEEFFKGGPDVLPYPAGHQRAGASTGTGANDDFIRASGNQNRSHHLRPD